MSTFRGVTGNLAVVLALATLLNAHPASADGDTIGSIKIASGNTSLLRMGGETPARVGLKLLHGDTLVTGPDGRLGVILRDDSIISLGP